jgi:hypothetical protein
MSEIEAHDKLGHIGMQAVKSTAMALGWVLTKSEMVCEACAEGKARQKSIMSKQTKGDELQILAEFIWI